MNILVLGGTKMIGRKLIEEFLKKTNYKITLANRNLTSPALFNNLNKIIIDRDNKESCQIFKYTSYDIVIDISCYNIDQFINTYNFLNFNKYIFISTSAVEAIPFRNVSPDMYKMVRYAYCKKECEDFIKDNIKDYQIIRPCYVVGKYDYTNRFYKENNKYYWKNGTELSYFIENESLVKFIIENIENSNNLILNPCKSIL
jgi:hypothetical protein